MCIHTSTKYVTKNKFNAQTRIKKKHDQTQRMHEFVWGCGRGKAFSNIPARESKMEDRGSVIKSDETTSSDVTPKTPFILPSDSFFMAATISL